MPRHPDILRRGQTALLVIDIQQRLARVMDAREALVRAVDRLARGARVLGVPVLVTEQVPEKLGPVVSELDEALEGALVIPKETFSCCGENEVLEMLRTHGARQVVLCGMETHVCVQQTALDLLAEDFQVHVAVDAVISRKPLDHDVALERMKSAGVVLTTTESILFELLERAGAEEFKAIQNLVKK